jgi:hypothetical protein
MRCPIFIESAPCTTAALVINGPVVCRLQSESLHQAGTERRARGISRRCPHLCPMVWRDCRLCTLPSAEIAQSGDAVTHGPGKFFLGRSNMRGIWRILECETRTSVASPKFVAKSKCGSFDCVWRKCAKLRPG